MNKRIFAFLCLALIVAFATVGVYPVAADAQPAPQFIPSFAPTAGTDYLSIPAAAFEPASQDYDYSNNGSVIKAFVGVDNYFRAPIYLPVGAKITDLAACFFDNTTANTGNLSLLTTDVNGAGIVPFLASIPSWNSSPNFGVAHYSGNLNVEIDQSNSYWVEYRLPPSDGTNNVWGCGVFIQYTPPATETGILVIPSIPAFKPFEDGYNAGITQSAGILKHYTTPAGAVEGTYLAQVSLPDGAQVNKMTLYYTDLNVTEDINLHLVRSWQTTSTEMAVINSENASYHGQSTTAITSPVIDNHNYAYWAYVNMPANTSCTSCAFFAMTVEYALPAADSGWVAISNPAFTGLYDNYDYENHGRWLFHLHDESGGTITGSYFAPVNLPQGARVDSVEYSFFDNSATKNGTAHLNRTKLGYGYELSNASSGSGGDMYTTVVDTSIVNSIIDNSQYAYYVALNLPVSSTTAPPANTDVVGVRINIEYTEMSPVYLPLVRK